MNKALLARPTNGLGNRLRLTFSSYLMAQHLKRAFYLDWPLFGELWERPFNSAPQTLGEPSEACAVSRYQAVTLSRPRAIERIEQDDAEVIILGGGQSFIPSSVTLGSYNTQKHLFYNSLTPHPEIEDLAAAFVEDKLRGHRVLGVQFRAGDIGAGRLGWCLSLEDTRPFIDPYVNDFDIIFMATNDPSFIPILQSYYPQKQVISYTRKLDVVRDGGPFWQNKSKLHIMKEDLIEWYILAEVDLLIYSHESSYGYESLFINKRANAIEAINPKRVNSPAWRNNHRPLVYTE